MFLFSLYFIFFTKKTFNYVILPFKKGFPDLEREDSYFTYLSYNNISNQEIEKNCEIALSQYSKV